MTDLEDLTNFDKYIICFSFKYILKTNRFIHFKKELIDFLTCQISKLKSMHPKAAIMVGGDRNSIGLDILSNFSVSVL